MDENNKPKRTRHVDPMKRIKKIDEQIAKLQAEKEDLMKPLSAQLLLEQVSKTMSYEDLVEKLGVKLDE